MSTGFTIGHYRVTAKLGEGGMGAVYRATDTKLNRDVAIKILPDAFAADPERMARFAREAQVVASLNHPNIAAIYGIEEGAMIMELVEGANLAGPVPLETALDYARRYRCENSRMRDRRPWGPNDQCQIVSPNSSPINCSCASGSPLPTHLARPFRIMWTASIPFNVLHVVENDW